jgi:hypothetical protein
VQDPSAVAAPGTVRDVLWATRLMWISFCAGAVGFILQIVRPAVVQLPMPRTVQAIALTCAAVIGLLMTWWFTSKLKAGRNWMRILLTVLLGLGILFPLLTWDYYKAAMLMQYAVNPVKSFIDVGQYVLYFVVVALLYTARSRAWFAAMKDA